MNGSNGADATKSFTVLVLAGQRNAADPVATARGYSHKALVPIHGTPMLVRVVRALLDSGRVKRILVSIETPSLLDQLPALQPLLESSVVRAVPAAGSPSMSVRAILEGNPSDLPLLVTTADHPLLTPAMVRHFLSALPPQADVAAAVVQASIIQRAYPGSIRTYFRFRDEAVTGCNLFAFLSPKSVRAAAFWRQVEQNRKKPLRMFLLLGPGAVLRFATRTLTLSGAVERLSRRAGVTAATIMMPFAEAGIDVDKPSDLALAEAILANRQEPCPVADVSPQR